MQARDEAEPAAVAVKAVATPDRAAAVAKTEAPVGASAARQPGEAEDR